LQQAVCPTIQQTIRGVDVSRRKKPSVLRDPDGKSRGEPAALVRAVALAQRIREVGAEHAANPLAGHALGRLRLRHQPHGPQDPCSISPEQYEAGERYAAIAARHAALMGYATGSPKSAGFGLLAAGASCLEEPDEQVILAVRREFSDCYRALMDAGRAIGQGAKVALMTYDTCLDRRSLDGLSRADIGNLKVGLNALARLFRGRGPA
jgi:hypothetical protein